jgi:hypothetical protein
MTLSALGIFSAAGAGGVQGDYELIETITLGTATASVTFSSLASYASTYKHLQVRAATRTGRTGFATGAVSLRFNGDTSTSYRYHELFGNGSSVSSFADSAQSSIRSAFVGASADTVASGFGATVLDVLDAFSATKNTTTRSLSGVATGGVTLNSGLYFQTNAVSSMTFTCIASTNFAVGSRFSLYGIRG